MRVLIGTLRSMNNNCGKYQIEMYEGTNIFININISPKRIVFMSQL